MLRGEDSITERVANILSFLDELKTSQYTSQNSGMKFKNLAEVSGTIHIPKNQQTVIIASNQFKPESGRPAICIPSFEIRTEDFIIHANHDYSIGYTSYTIMDLTDRLEMGYLDVWDFYHLAQSDDGTYIWQTIMYGDAYYNYIDLPFYINVRSTDSGEHTLNVESHAL